MENRIRSLSVRDRSLIAAQAEVWIVAEVEKKTPSTELRGRLMGPSCPYANTVEVAYALRPLPQPLANEVTSRVVIPEASLWDPESPFLYHGPIELWQDGHRCERIILSHGLRSIQLTKNGLYVNGRMLKLRGRFASSCSEDEARTMRKEGYNLLIVPIAEDTLPIWERADRLGFFVLGWLKDVSNQSSQHLTKIGQHTSCLGWLLCDNATLDFHILPQDGLVGLMCESPPHKLSLSVVHFLFGPAELAKFGLPLLVNAETCPATEGGSLLGHTY
jgi:hypothetical protein